MIYDLVLDGAVIRTTDFGDVTPPDLSLHPQKGIWLPHVVTGDDTTTNPALELTIGVVVGTDQVTYVGTLQAKTGAALEALRQAKIEALSAEYASRWTAPIQFSVASAGLKTWDADPEAITNIMGEVVMIGAGAPVPDPRPWHAKDEIIATMITHAELVGLGATIGGRKDALLVVKKAKQGEIQALTSASLIVAYDVTSGWA